jgi:hypothetical protein
MTLSAQWADSSGHLKDDVIVRTTYGPVTNEVSENHQHVAAFWAQLGRLLAERPEHREARGRVMYERYADHADGRSAVTGEPLPAWDEAEEEIREHWRHAAAG